MRSHGKITRQWKSTLRERERERGGGGGEERKGKKLFSFLPANELHLPGNLKS